jgi:colanic acid biosynthesis protein WcaH
MNMIPIDQYNNIISVMPVLCVDLLLRNSKGEFLFVRRANEPKKDQWWPVGGRVIKGETLEQAAVRKIQEETSLSIHNLHPVGYFETVNDVHPFNLENSYHAVSVVFIADIDDDQTIRLDPQSKGWKYSLFLPREFLIHPFVTGKNGNFLKGDLSPDLG